MLANVGMSTRLRESGFEEKDIQVAVQLIKASRPYYIPH